MKKLLFTFCFLLVVLPINVFATSIEREPYYINDNGIEMTETQFNKLKRFYDPLQIKTMDQLKFNFEVNAEFNLADSTEKFFATTTYYDRNRNVIGVAEEEISETEFNNFDSIRALINNRTNNGYDYSYIETNAKRFVMEAFYIGNTYVYPRVHVICMWKYMPTVKSYDNIGLRHSRGELTITNSTGTQIYRTSAGIQIIDYGWKGNNMVRYGGMYWEGLGISMNLVDAASDILSYDEPWYYKNTLIMDGTTSGQLYDDLTIYSSYQHAMQDTPLSQAKSYIISNLGLGGVFYFSSDAISDKYDGMSGINVTI